MKKIISLCIIIALLLPCFVFADTQSVTIDVTVSGIYQNVNHWKNATYTFDVTDGTVSEYGWLSNGEYSFKFYHKDGVIKGGARKAVVFSCDHIPEVIVIPNKIGAINSEYFTYMERDITLYAASDDEGIFVSNQQADTTIVVPEGVSEISQCVFGHNHPDNKRMNFVLPSTLRTIGKNAFSCYSNGGMYIPFELPEGLVTIGTGAFASCRFESITIPSTVTTIDASAFKGNSKLTSVIFKGEIESIGSKAFETCNVLKSMTFEGHTAPALETDTFRGFLDGFEFYVYYPYDGVGYDNEDWRSCFPPNTHFLMVDANGEVIPEEEKENIYKDQIDAMRLKWREMLLCENADINDPDIAVNIKKINDTAQGFWDIMDTSESRTRIFSDRSLYYDSELYDTYDRLLAMAQAYGTAGCELYHNSDMLADIISALDYIDDSNSFSATSSAMGNWWHYQIGIPRKLVRICIVLYDELTLEQKLKFMSATRHFQNDITMSGANRMWECEVFIGRGIVESNAANIQSAKEGISAVIGMVTGGDGYYDDGSFIQHTQYPYNGGYGYSLFANIAELGYILDDSPWEINEAAESNIYRWVYDAYMPFVYKGQFMDMVRGREISRYYSDTYVIGAGTIASIVTIAQFAPDRFADDFKSMVKYWCAENDQVNLYANMPNYSVTLIKDIMDDENIQQMDEPLLYRQFYNMDRAVQVRPGYGVGISMHSTRIGNFESINSENQHADHTSDGMIYLYNDDLRQYHDGFWPTVNLGRFSGITVERNAAVKSNALGTSPWAGGVAIGDKYGVTSMQLKTPGQTLEAKKSYFMFDDEIVCLGSDINSDDDYMVETVVENRRLSSADDVLTVNGTVKEGAEEEFTDVKWALLDGKYADIGYYFPDAVTMKALTEERSGTWKNVSSKTDDITYTANYATMFIEHGIKPEKESYEYVILPDKDAEQTQTYTENPDITVLANNEEIQAVQETKNNIIGVNFWTDGEKSIGGITSDMHGTIITELENGVLSVAAADPAQTNDGWMNIEIDTAANCVITTDSNIIVYQVAPTIKMSVYMGKKTGESYSAIFDISGDDAFDYGKDVYVIDNTDEGFETDGSSWKASSYGTHHYGENYLLDGNSNADAARWAKWTPDIAQTDEYDIYIRWNSSAERPANVPLEIVHADGTDTTKYINQKYSGSIWTYLGTYRMNKGTEGYVKMLASGEGNTCADAVKFVARSAEGNSPDVYVDMQNTAVMADVVCENGFVTAARAQNAQSIGVSADLIVAVYDGIKLVNLQIMTDISTAETMALATPLPYEEGNTIKAFLWDADELNNLTE